MRPRFRHLLVLACAAVLAAPLAVPAAAGANAFDDVLAVFERDGDIDPCAFSGEQLREARQQMPDDIAETNPDFPPALDSAIASRDVECEDRTPTDPTSTAPAAPPPATTGPTGPTSPATPTPAPTPSPPATNVTPPAPTPPVVAPEPTLASSTATATETVGRTGGWIPALIIVLGVVGAVLLLAGLFVVIGSKRGWFEDDGPLGGAAHAVREAGLRVGLTWAEFTDWVRLGR